MRPDTLAQAVQFITEEDNIKYYQRSNTQHIPPKIPTPNTQNFQTFRLNQNQVRPFPQQPNFNQQPYFPRPPMSNQFPRPSTSNQFPRGPINMQRHPNPPPQKFPTNAQVFGRPQNVQNVWKPNSQAPQPKPTPMSVSTRNTTPHFKPNYQQNNFFRNNGQKPNFISEELFHTEFDEQQQCDYDTAYTSYEQSYENHYNDETEAQDENFQEPHEQTEET